MIPYERRLQIAELLEQNEVVSLEMSFVNL